MTASRKLLFLSAFLSLFVFACTDDKDEKLDKACDVEGAFECLETAGADADHRICTDGKWVESKCAESKICKVAACVEEILVCEKTATRCTDAKTVELCTADEAAKIEICGDGLVCDAAACASGEACCVPTDVCEKTATRCTDAKTVEICTASEAAKVEVCGDGLICDALACASGEPCCVPTALCKETATRCMDEKTVEVCTASEAAKVEVCGDGLICDAVACADGGDCCVVPDACKVTATRCLSLTTTEVCVEKEAAKLELCGDGYFCDAVACAKGEACCAVGKICSENVTQCSDLKTIERCTANEVAQTEICGDGFVCDSGACVVGKVCSSTASQCLNLHTAEICVEGGREKTETCGESFHCDAVACASGEDCCVAGKVCTETATQCANLKTIERCTASEVVKLETCGDGLVCDSGACVPGKVCSATASVCLDLRSAEICVADGRAEVEICGEGFYCESTTCATGKECCVPGEICKATLDTCLDDDTRKLCVAEQRPVEQACGAGKKCDAAVCVDDGCSNGRLDTREVAVDCGGWCAPCVSCRVNADCGVDGFCDSASGYVCSKRCRNNADCNNSALWDGDYCRGDGRCSPKVFETVWEITSADLTVVLPFDVNYSNAKCDFQILWGDESEGTDITALPRVIDCTAIANRTHVYATAGTYHVKLIGTYDGWGIFDAINANPLAAPKLRSVLSFGPVGLSHWTFHGASMLAVMPKKDVPDASKLYSLANAFNQAKVFNAAIGHWDTSNVVLMQGFFEDASAFNQPIGQWNTSKVVNMSYLFKGAKVFNQPIGDWNTSQVYTMEGMFSGATVFNQPIGAWNTAKVNNMGLMFGAARAFNRPIGTWNTSEVLFMASMFWNADRFNQPIGAWNTSKLRETREMFAYALAFNQDIGTWDVSQVSNLRRMFFSALKFNQDLSAWTLKDAAILQYIFADSDMSRDFICLLKAKGGEWLAQWVDLGVATGICD